MASSGDVVESPNFPHKYDSLSNCKWTLEGPQGHIIFLQVIVFLFICRFIFACNVVSHPFIIFSFLL